MAICNPLIDHIDVLRHTMLFASGEGYLFVAGVSTSWEYAWGDRPCETKLEVAVRSLSCLAWARDCWCPWDGTTCSLAARSGCLESLQYARATGCVWGSSTCTSAARSGNLNVLKWCRTSGCPWNAEETFKAAAQAGNKAMMKWCIANGVTWSNDLLTGLAKEGRLDLIKWCWSGPCRLKRTRSTSLPHPRWSMYASSVKKLYSYTDDDFDFDDVKLDCDASRQANYYYDSDDYDAATVNTTATRENITIGPDFHIIELDSNKHVYSAAAGGGHIDVLKWCQSKGLPWGNTTAAAAAAGGHLEVLQWIKGVRSIWWDNLTCPAAARFGHLDVLRWCRDNYCYWDHNTCTAAAGGGHLRVLQWCRENGCVWSVEACNAAAEGGHLRVLQWCRGNGCPWDKVRCFEAAQNGGNIDVIRWCRNNGCEWSGADVWTLAAQRGFVDVLEWYRANGCPFTTQHQNTCVRAAVRVGNVEVLDWCWMNHCPCDMQMIGSIAVAKGCFEMLRWCEVDGCFSALGEYALVAAQEGRVRELRWCRDNGCEFDRSVFDMVVGNATTGTLQFFKENDGLYGVRKLLRAANTETAKRPKLRTKSQVKAIGWCEHYLWLEKQDLPDISPLQFAQNYLCHE